MADANHTELRCVVCGCAFRLKLRKDGTLPRNHAVTCGGACRNKRAASTPKQSERACLECGAMFSGRDASVHCSSSCAAVEWRRSRRAATIGHCANCGASLADKKNRTKLCGKACRSQSRRVPRKHVNCLACGSALTSRAKFCSGRCKQRAGPPRACVICATPITKPKQMRYCSDECSLTGRRAYDAISCARRRGAPSARFSAFAVFDRDGWRCQICGVSTPRSRRGTRHHNAPELDHIVPLKMGGEHSMANTQ
jgi:predicted nucleic acid-binding Zn ribbon protein